MLESFEGKLQTLREQVKAETRDYLTLKWPPDAYNSSSEIPRYIYTIITF